MNIDFHTHGRLAKFLPFSEEYTTQLFEQAIANGLDAICLTEHFNTIEFDKIYDYMINNLEQVEDAFCYKELKIFPGMEIDAAEGGHMLAIGNYQDILRLNRQLSGNMDKGNFLPAKDILDYMEPEKFLIGIAHPFREKCKLYMLPKEELGRFDFVDMNGKDIASYGSEVVESKVSQLANEIGANVLAGSDTHQSLQYGCIYTRFFNSCTSVRVIKENVKSQAYEVMISKDICLKVEVASTVKKVLKEIHAMGRDYIEVYKKMFQGVQAPLN